MCVKLPPENLNSVLCPPHPISTSTYSYRVTTTPRVLNLDLYESILYHKTSYLGLYTYMVAVFELTCFYVITKNENKY